MATKTIVRNGNVEVLRCLLMFLIVAYHCFIYGPCSSSKALWTMCFTVLICWHTDGFLAVSGWYGMRFRWSKVVRFIGQMSFYGALSWLYSWWVGAANAHPDFLGGWFGSSYLVLMFLAPVVNWVVGRGKWGGGLVAALMLLFFCSWITGRFGAGMVQVKKVGLHSVLLMVYIYGVGQLLRKILDGKKPQLRYLLMGMGVFVVSLPLFHVVDVLHRHQTGVGISGIGCYFAAYDALHVVIMAFSVLMLVIHYVQFPKWCSCLAVRISSLLFGTYLLGTTSFGGQFYRFENWLVNDLSVHGFLAVILTAILIFLVSFGIEMVRKSLVKLIRANELLDGVLSRFGLNGVQH